MQFTESGWRFRFSPAWKVKRFDAHRYYRWLSGSGLKGLDFLAYQANERLLLMEVKNYRDQEPPTAQELATLFYRKASDSQRIIHVIQSYYFRKPLYRLLFPLIKNKPNHFGDWGFWTEAADLLQELDRCDFVLWLVGTRLDDAYHSFTKVAIEQQLGSHHNFHLLPYQQTTAELGLDAESLK